jgi:hypothetical protein
MLGGQMKLVSVIYIVEISVMGASAPQLPSLGLVRFSNFASRPVPVPGLDQVDPGVTLKPGQIHPSLGFKTGIKNQCLRLFRN